MNTTNSVNAKCSVCHCAIIFAEGRWVHDYNIAPMLHAAKLEIPATPAKHKHQLRFCRVSKKGKRLVFVCTGCGKEQMFVRSRVHLLLTNVKTKFVKKDRSN